MAKKARQRISYVLELDHSSSGGHRLGVNGLAVDTDRAVLYSGGRDGIVCAWDLETPDPSTSKPRTKFLSSTQAHTHWINDIVLAPDKSALVSASSDLTVKVWRPLDNGEPAHTIGQHSDYVKCVATTNGVNWVASGGLDRKIKLWDLNGAGETLEIDTQGEDIQEKGSVYALSVGRNIIANGGPESSVRLWDPRSGKRVTKFVGHTDMVRSILVSERCDTIMTASSDQTIKVWSVTAGRCMHTLTMHNDSVWSLSSDHPELDVFYSSDRSGLVVKTDHDGVSKIVTTNDYVWTASASSSINRWANVDTSPDALVPDEYKAARASMFSSMPEQVKQLSANGERSKIPANSILRISHTAAFPPQILNSSEPNLAAPSLDTTGRGSELIDPIVANATEPIYHLPEETIEGQNGLVKHRLLNDRRRVLTLDTAGDVLLWDLIQCKVISRFGKKHMEDVEPQVNTTEAVAPWCSIDTSSGNLAVVLEPFNCFDAEMYADELVTDEPIEFRDDQRINLGKWVLRYLFAKLIDEEIKRDEDHRNKLNESVAKRQAAARANPPTSIQIPNSPGWDENESAVVTPKGNDNYPMTPSMAIAVATPGPASHLPGVPENAAAPASPQEKKSSQIARASSDDYFSSGITSAEAPAKAPVTPAAAEKEPETPKSPTEAKEKENGKGTFGKKFRMGMSFGSKKLGRSASSNIEKPVIVEEKKDDENKSESSSNHEKEVDDSFLGVLQRLRNVYDKQLQDAPDKFVETKITPSLPSDTPVLKLPAGTRVIIQEETSGGSADLYRGTVETVGNDADMIEQKAPMWLGEVLLTILSYVAERIDPSLKGADENALKPEEYLELYCNEQLLPIDMSLATLRAHIWKGGSDVVLYYKANGRKELPRELPQLMEQPQPQEHLSSSSTAVETEPVPAERNWGTEPASAKTWPKKVKTWSDEVKLWPAKTKQAWAEYREHRNDPPPNLPNRAAPTDPAILASSALWMPLTGFRDSV
ncbi:WD repeat protein-like protein [Apiospora phragmitis]|uniref:WD repeat protein-like protein n=1 Tax=Apiospora phragmitis TaxID=2905665 RepID=A0ABR1WVN8_9PEZI